MANYKLVPNQKEVKVMKEPCDKAHYYAMINLDAMQQAAVNLAAPAFKLWVYFAKNQNGYEFALSSKDVLESFGMKKDQYDGAVKKLIEGGYLVAEGGSKYSFHEIPVVAKAHNEAQNESCVVGKNHNTVVGNPYKELQEIPTRNIIDNTNNNTNGISPSVVEITIAPPEAAAKPIATREKKALWKF